MTTKSVAARLKQTVDCAIKEHGLELFAQYWDLYREITSISNVRRFYARTEGQPLYTGGYCNVAIIGDGLLVDIEGDDSRRSGGLSVESLDSIAKVTFHVGELPGLPAARGASLVVLAQGVGETDVGLHWVAKTEDEEDRLVEFARELVAAVSQH